MAGDPIGELVALFARLPGIGERTATRLAFFVLESPPELASGLGEALSKLHDRVKRCRTCGNFGADELCTRFRFAVMLERYGLQPGPCTTVPATSEIQATGALLDEWFASTWYTWRGVARQPRVMGQGELIVRLSREHNVPIWLCLGIGWYESCWCTGGLSLTYNCGWGIKDVKGKWGSIRGVVSGFADYTSVEEMITAFFRLMDSPGYRGYIDARHWDALLERYAPSFENDHRAHVATVRTVRRWCEERGIR